jgi:hypothetical protein
MGRAIESSTTRVDGGPGAQSRSGYDDSQDSGECEDASSRTGDDTRAARVSIRLHG